MDRRESLHAPRDAELMQVPLRTIFLFPGQGAHHVGMGRALHEQSQTVRRLFAQADDILRIPLTALCFEGPEAELRRTEVAQPALFTVGVAAATLLEERGVRPDAALGHSVGEYAALATAGALSFEHGLRAVRRRAELMAVASSRTPGMMAAILGLPVDAVARICVAASDVGYVEIACDNGPRQAVVAGEPAAVERAMDLAEEREGATAVPLAVEGAFHSRLMRPAAAEFATVLATVQLRAPRIPVVANITGDYVQTPSAIRDALVGQMTATVRWRESLRRLAAAGAQLLIEMGPGRTLAGLAREIVPGVPARATEDVLGMLASAAGS